MIKKTKSSDRGNAGCKRLSFPLPPLITVLTVIRPRALPTVFFSYHPAIHFLYRILILRCVCTLSVYTPRMITISPSGAGVTCFDYDIVTNVGTLMNHNIGIFLCPKFTIASAITRGLSGMWKLCQPLRLFVSVGVVGSIRPAPGVLADTRRLFIAGLGSLGKAIRSRIATSIPAPWSDRHPRADIRSDFARLSHLPFSPVYLRPPGSGTVI